MPHPLYVAFIWHQHQPVINGFGDPQDWNQVGRIEINGTLGKMHRNGKFQLLFYGLDHLNFYLRLDSYLPEKGWIMLPAP